MKLRRLKYQATPYIFIFPNLLLFSAFVIIPLFYNFYISGSEWNIISTPSWVGIENYKTIFQEEEFFQSLFITVKVLFLTVPFSIAGALLMAVFLNNKIKGLSFFRTSIYMPAIISSVVVGMLFMWMFNSEYGVINDWLEKIGLERVYWFNDKKMAIIPVAIATIWMKLGYNMVIYIAGLQGIPETVYEAAEIDGASPIQRFFYMTLPLLKNTHIFLIITSIISTFRAFDLIYVMTGGGPQGSTTTIVMYIYRKAFEIGKMGEASAAGIVLFCIVAGITLLQLSITREKEK